MTPQIDHLPAGELKFAVSANVDELPEKEALAVKDFIERIGGRENAMLAVKMLDEVGPR